MITSRQYQQRASEVLYLAGTTDRYDEQQILAEIAVAYDRLAHLKSTANNPQSWGIRSVRRSNALDMIG
jgi:hypothetical protein